MGCRFQKKLHFEKSLFLIDNSIQNQARNVDVRIIENTCKNDTKMEPTSLQNRPKNQTSSEVVSREARGGALLATQASPWRAKCGRIKFSGPFFGRTLIFRVTHRGIKNRPWVQKTPKASRRIKLPRGHATSLGIFSVLASILYGFGKVFGSVLGTVFWIDSIHSSISVVINHSDRIAWISQVFMKTQSAK